MHALHISPNSNKVLIRYNVSTIIKIIYIKYNVNTSLFNLLSDVFSSCSHFTWPRFFVTPWQKHLSYFGPFMSMTENQWQSFIHCGSIQIRSFFPLDSLLTERFRDEDRQFSFACRQLTLSLPILRLKVSNFDSKWCNLLLAIFLSSPFHSHVFFFSLPFYTSSFFLL